MIVSNLKKEINGKIIFADINFSLDNNEKAILIGINGAGKSTLLKTIAGIIPKDNGKINANGEKIAMLKQEIPTSAYELSVIEYIKKEIGIYDLENKLHELESDLKESNIELYGDLLDQFLKLDGYNLETNLLYIMSGLKLSCNLDKKIGSLSGGEKIKVLLTILILSNADILLLDEPTNNLDIEAILWLEHYLQLSDKKMIIVSHDEEFISCIGTKIFELENGNLREYKQNFNDYTKMKEQEYQALLEKHQKKEEEKEKVKAALQKQKEWTRKGLKQTSNDNDKIAANFKKEKTKKTSGRISQLTKDLERLNEPDEFKKKEEIELLVNLSTSKGNTTITINDLICGYPDFHLPSLNFSIPFGTRLQIVGPNGSGKSTLIKTIIGNISPISGSITLGSAIKIGYISQDSFNLLSNDITVYDYLNHDSKFEPSFVFTMLNKFHIKYENKDNNYNNLSPGERTRVNLVKLALEEINVLILDEATNHLDMEAIKLLESVITTFNGTIICISHNRKFNDILNPDMVLDIQSGQINYD